MVIYLLFTGTSRAEPSGNGTKSNLTTQLLEARQGNPVAMVEVAGTLLEISRVNNDEGLRAHAFGWMLAAARQGHAEAAELTGRYYRNGTGVEQNFAKSEKWLMRAKQRKSGGADFELALYYRDERNPSRDQHIAARYLNAALKRKDPRACILAAFQKIQRQTPLRAALKELICAAEGGVIPAMLVLADYYEKRSSPNAAYKSRTWLKKAAAAGSPVALERLFPLP